MTTQPAGRGNSSMHLAETNMYIRRGVTTLYSLVHNSRSRSTRPEERHYVLRTIGRRSERLGLRLMTKGDGYRVLYLKSEPRIQLRLTHGNPFDNPPAYSIAGGPAVQMFRCDRGTVWLAPSGDSLQFSTIKVDKPDARMLTVKLAAAIGLYGDNPMFRIDRADPQFLIKLLDEIGNSSDSLLKAVSQQSHPSFTRPVPAYLLHNLRDAVHYYLARKYARRLDRADLKQIGTAIIASAQPIVLATGHRLADMLTEPPLVSA